MSDGDADRLVIAALEDRRAAAIIAADVDTLAAMTDADYVHVETSGRVRTKQDFLETLRSGPGRFERYDIRENVIQLYGDAAVVTGVFENAYRAADGQCTAKTARHIRVYVRRSGGWMNVSHQATALDTAARSGRTA
ncbi:hypothetical protein sos41_07580 [Alphaproteobacteria bacterium SO-S41]|nr:hypothetical protein sos41_07580 [Alphaproteobacteria bacterium SO-S41]